MDAARWLVGGKDETDEALSAFGLVRQGGYQPGIWPEHVQAVEVFAALLTQWRMGPMGGVVGLDYSAIPPTLELMGVETTGRRELFEQLRIMEREAVKTINERKR
jgi:hypothetical protein